MFFWVICIVLWMVKFVELVGVLFFMILFCIFIMIRLLVVILLNIMLKGLIKKCGLLLLGRCMEK